MLKVTPNFTADSLECSNTPRSKPTGIIEQFNKQGPDGFDHWVIHVNQIPQDHLPQQIRLDIFRVSSERNGPSLPFPICRLVTSIHSMTPRPCQLYIRPVPPRFGYIPHNTSAVSVSFLLLFSCTPTYFVRHSVLTASSSNLEFVICNLFALLINSSRTSICLSICIRIVHAVARSLR